MQCESSSQSHSSTSDKQENLEKHHSPSSHKTQSSKLPTKRSKPSTQMPKSNNKFQVCSEDAVFKHFHHDSRHYISCIACCKFPGIVKNVALKSQIPPIAQLRGVIFRKETVVNHLQQSYHKESVKALRLSTLPQTEAQQETELGRSISKGNEKLANRIGSLLIHTYGDAKKLTLSAYSFPARVIVGEIASAFEFNNTQMTTAKDMSFQYLTPTAHKEFLQCIVESNVKTLIRKLTVDSLALSLRCDGSVDRTQIDKIYVMAKVISKRGYEENYFLGASEPTERGAEGVLNAVETACITTVGSAATTVIFQNTSSLVTDGASVNTGAKSGLWALFKSKMRKQSIESEDNNVESIPLLTIWCGVHRSNLAWKSTSKLVNDVDALLHKLVGISTFFHGSGLRTRELKDTASANKLNLLAIPKLFEVRWTEFSLSLLNAILTSWNCIVLYMKQSSEKEASGFLYFLCDEDNLLLMAFLADVLMVFSRYQRQLQSDSITILDLQHKTNTVKSKLLALKDHPLTGGWFQTYTKSVQEQTDGSLTLKGIPLTKKSGRQSKNHNLYVSQKRDVSAVCNEVVLSLAEFLEQRFEIDDNLLLVLKPFATLKKSADLDQVHKMICEDLDLTEIALEYGEILSLENIEFLRQLKLSSLVRFLASSDEYTNVATAMARILAAKPHSADVERLISTSTALKSITRSSLSVESENEYLFVHHNMPPLIEWKPQAAVLLWLKKREHRLRDTPKATDQDWFNGIFHGNSSESTDNKEIQTYESDNDQEDGSHKTKKQRLF